MNGSTFVVEAALPARYQNGQPYQYREGDDIGNCFIPLFDRSCIILSGIAFIVYIGNERIVLYTCSECIEWYTVVSILNEVW